MNTTDTTTEYLLEATEVSKRYGAVLALKSASLRVRPGEAHALMGANGAGKSTLVKVLTGADDARVAIAVTRLESMPPDRKMPTGTSATSCLRTLSASKSSNSSSNSSSDAVTFPSAAGSKEYRES